LARTSKRRTYGFGAEILAAGPGFVELAALVGVGSRWKGGSALCRERLGEEIRRRGGGPGDKRSARSTASRVTAGGPRSGGVFAAWCTESVERRSLNLDGVRWSDSEDGDGCSVTNYYFGLSVFLFISIYFNLLFLIKYY